MSISDYHVAESYFKQPCLNQPYKDPTVDYVTQNTNTVAQTGSFTRANRLLTPAQFSTVFEKPYKRHHAYLLILVRKNKLSENDPTEECVNSNRETPARMGLAVAKKNIKLAVRRNRFKRIVRESFRLHKVQLAGLDIVVLAKQAANGATSQQIRTVLEQQWQHLAKHFNIPSY